MVHTPERRTSPRCRVDWPVSLQLNGRSQVFGGRGRDLSHTGALVAMPISVPLCPGQRTEVRLYPRPNAAGGAPKTESERRCARVVRVDRGRTLLEGLQLVGLKFDE